MKTLEAHLKETALSRSLLRTLRSMSLCVTSNPHLIPDSMPASISTPDPSSSSSSTTPDSGSKRTGPLQTVQSKSLDGFWGVRVKPRAERLAPRSFGQRGVAEATTADLGALAVSNGHQHVYPAVQGSCIVPSYLSPCEALAAGSLSTHSSGSTFFPAKPLVVPPRT